MTALRRYAVLVRPRSDRGPKNEILGILAYSAEDVLTQMKCAMERLYTSYERILAIAPYDDAKHGEWAAALKPFELDILDGAPEMHP